MQDSHPTSTESMAAERSRQLLPSTLVLAAGASGTFLIQAIALRLMSVDQVGLLVLCLGIISVASAVASLGTAQLIPRLAALDRHVLEVRGKLLSLLALSATAVAVVCVGLSLALFGTLSSLGALGCLTLVAIVATRALQYLESGFRRGSGAFVSGAFVQQGAALITTGLLVAALLARSSLSPTAVLVTFLLSQILLLCFSVGTWPPQWARMHVRSWVQARRKQFTAYWWAASLTMGFLWADRLVVASLLPLDDLALYQSIVLMTTLFDVLALGIGYVHLPRYAVTGHRSAKDMAFLWALAMLAAIATLFFSLIIGGQLFLVDWSLETICVFAVLVLVGVAKLVYADLSSVLGGLAEQRELTQFARRMSLALASGILITAALTLEFGLIGAALGSGLTWLARLLICYKLTVRWHLRPA